MLQTSGNFSPYSRTFSFLISESFFSILTPELIQPKCTTFICIWGKKMYFLTECPSCSHDANLRMHVWSSNGKNATFTGHVDLNLVGGGQKTRPVQSTKAKLLIYSPLKSSALKITQNNKLIMEQILQRRVGNYVI